MVIKRHKKMVFGINNKSNKENKIDLSEHLNSAIFVNKWESFWRGSI